MSDPGFDPRTPQKRIKTKRKVINIHKKTYKQTNNHEMNVLKTCPKKNYKMNVLTHSILKHRKL